ncbi:MAG TPA: hypothetical protein VL241_09350 [Gemmatimonadales bacterium]|jgi:hypothetical protein|nr:hypothetical protein [Gemmatimonadales bacterium]
MYTRGGGLLLLAVLAGSSCRPAKPAAGTPAMRVEPPVVTEAAVVAFWLARADTLPEATRSEVRERFRRSNAQVGQYLSDTDIGLVATVNDSVVVSLAGGPRRVLTLVGLDYPYGYVLIDPGYAEEYHTGIPEEADLEAAIDDYFGLEDPAPPSRHRIALVPPGNAHGLLDIVSRRREGSALRNRTVDARVVPAAVERRGCAGCAWVPGAARRWSGAAAGRPPRPRARSLGARP